MTNESYKVKGFTWGTCTTELARISLASGYFTVVFSIIKFLRRKKKPQLYLCIIFIIAFTLLLIVLIYATNIDITLIGTIVIIDIDLHEYNSRLTIKLWNLLFGTYVDFLLRKKSSYSNVQKEEISGDSWEGTIC